jgi:toluene monooxygenase system protein D
MTHSDVGDERVGPILQSAPLAAAIVSAIEQDNKDVVVRDEGAYIRVEAPRICRLQRATLEAAAGEAISFPGDLEVLMPAFAGSLQLTEDSAIWWFGTEPPAEESSPATDGQS